MKRIFKISIGNDIESGLGAVSLVEEPAIEVDFLTFSKDDMQKMRFFNEEEHIVSGPAILADTLIYRYKPEMGEFYIYFDKETIKKLIIKYFKNNRANSVNIEHSEEVNGITLIESYIKNTDRGVSPIEFKDIPDGSWITSYYVSDPALWERIKKGEVKGFSVEGKFFLDEVAEADFSKDNDTSRRDISCRSDNIDNLIDRILNDDSVIDEILK